MPSFPEGLSTSVIADGHGSLYHRNAKECITRFFKKRELLSRDFLSSSRRTAGNLKGVQSST
jgi:hypothetical protein